MTDRIGNCRIVGEIGSGGMAVVYRAVQEPLGREVAIKALKPSIAVDSQFAKRFEREAHFMASLQHENILHVYDFIKDGRSMFITMEYVRGIDLYDLLERTPRLPIDVACIIALQVARALDYAHFRGIIHRDIKPANVMLSHQGEVKLMDFGIARDDNLTDLTETGTGLGTPSYMSPEQILGDKLDFRSDIFSLGIVFYQMVTGQKPFVEDEARTVMQKIRLDRYQSPRKVNPEVPRSLERILARCMEKMPANRYSTTQALIDDLMEFLAVRISMNHSARIVMYLRDIGFLSDDEADEILDQAGPRSVRRQASDTRMLRNMGLVQGGLFLALAVGGVAIQVASGGFDRAGQESAALDETTLAPDEAGFLNVVAKPWAEVWIDGKQVFTTPTATPWPLAPGVHYVQLKNPYFTAVTQQVTIEKGQTFRLETELEPLTEAPTAEASGEEGGS